MHEIDREVIPASTPRPAAPALTEAASPTLARSLEEGSTHALTTDDVVHLQRVAGNASVTQYLDEGAPGDSETASPVRDFLGSSTGQPLDGPVRSSMEAALGTDLGDVRLHRGGDASASAASVQARAYTVGSDVVLGNDIEPSSSAGARTLAHELTHVVQQRSGPVDGTPAPGGIRLSDPGDRFERAAEANAEAITGGGPTASSAGATMSAPATAQREAAAPGEEPEEEVQGSFLQRQAAPGEEEEEETTTPA